MKNIWTIVKKELARVFTDKGMILSLFLLPPLTIYLIYGLMGMSAEKESNKSEKYIASVYVVNAPEQFVIEEDTIISLKDFINNLKTDEAFLNSYNNSFVINGNVTYINESEFDEYFQKLKNEEIDLIIKFPSDFAGKVELNDANKPNIQLFYNVNKTYSEKTFSDFSVALSQYQTHIASTRVDLDQLIVFNSIPENTGDVKKQQGSILGMILPMLLIIYLFTGAMSIGMESVAGEKERGTIATLLVTPVKRSELAIGKIISIAIIAVLSSIASFLGLVAVMPQFAKIGGDADVFGGLSYGITDFVMLFMVMFTAVLMFVSMIVIVSTYAKSTKQAGTLITPLLLIVMGSGFFNMFTMDITDNIIYYLIPVYNISLSLKAIFQFDMGIINWLITVISTFVYTVIFIFLIQKMFKSEKIMFNK